MNKWYLGLVLFWGLLSPAWANHIVGGNFEMVAVPNRPGRFHLYMNLFFDEIGGRTSPKERDIVISIFRKRDNNREVNIRMDLESDQPLRYTNPSCAEARNLKTSVLRYHYELNLDPKQYSDPQGYYVAFERCCRNTATVNLVSPGRSGMVFYLEFPALQRNGQAFQNSSPVFGTPNGEYLCVNKPFTLNFGASDADGDQLRYSLETPYMGFTTDARPSPSIPAPSPYPLVSWGNAYGVTNQIPGNPALQIDPNTGTLSVTPSQLGLFVFAVQVEEYRNGEKIGMARRDFQLLVVDCPDNTLPDPIVFQTDSTKQLLKGEVCESGSFDLKTRQLPHASYQWQKDGRNIEGATSWQYQAQSPGTYRVVISSTTVCSASKESESVTLTLKPGPSASITANVPLPACATQQIILSTLAGNYSYRWQRDGVVLPETTSSITVTRGGLYAVRVQSLDDACYYTPSQQIDIYDTPQARFQNLPPANQFCRDANVTLIAYDSTGYQFQWYRNGQLITGATQNRYVVQASGTYSFQVKIGNCTAFSPDYTAELYPETPATFEPIPSLCQRNVTKLTLRGTPTGGVFSGQGVVSGTDQFDPSLAGVGSFPLTYTYTNEQGCKTVVEQTATVSPAPRLNAGPDLGFVRGESVVIQTQSDDDLTFEWTPATGLSSTTIQSPTAAPDQTTRYTVRATSAAGCQVEDDVLVTVWEALTIPNAITPNGDGTNDTWELPGIEFYPNADVRIFNRWGTEIFVSKGYGTTFDGTYKGTRLPPATYYYVIQPNNGRPTLKGTLTLVY